MPPRERLSLDGLWQFYPAAVDGEPRQVPVPAPWQAVPELRHFEGGYLSFELDITPFVQPGTNLLRVRVSDPPELFAEIPHGKQSWYGSLSGIWQPVWLESRAPTHIQQVKITPHVDGRVAVSLRLSRVLEAGACLQVEVLGPLSEVDPEGELVARTQTSATQFDLQVAQPCLWDIDTPHLYQLRLALHAERAPDLPARSPGSGLLP